MKDGSLLANNTTLFLSHTHPIVQLLPRIVALLHLYVPSKSPKTRKLSSESTKAKQKADLATLYSAQPSFQSFCGIRFAVGLRLQNLIGDTGFVEATPLRQSFRSGWVVSSGARLVFRSLHKGPRWGPLRVLWVGKVTSLSLSNLKI